MFHTVSLLFFFYCDRPHSSHPSGISMNKFHNCPHWRTSQIIPNRRAVIQARWGEIWYNIDNMSEYVKALTPSLFWDVNRDEVDDDRHRRFIMQRVLERGTMNDWRLTKRRYSLPLIVAEAQQMRSLEPRALAFIACLGDVDESSFRCSALKQSHQRHWFY